MNDIKFGQLPQAKTSNSTQISLSLGRSTKTIQHRKKIWNDLKTQLQGEGKSITAFIWACIQAQLDYRSKL